VHKTEQKKEDEPAGQKAMGVASLCDGILRKQNKTGTKQRGKDCPPFIVDHKGLDHGDGHIMRAGPEARIGIIGEQGAHGLDVDNKDGEHG